REVDVVNMKVEIDEGILRQIASQTGGEYFRATDKQTLEAIYDQINTLEKSTVEVENRTLLHEEYLIFALMALVALLLEFIINRLLLNRIP
ncbi:MAG: aerotolerance regulator BatA, partial [Alistipes sp.]|nr:aerotolerance regulator BatA [Alistipes sp.]